MRPRLSRVVECCGCVGSGLVSCRPIDVGPEANLRVHELMIDLLDEAVVRAGCELRENGLSGSRCLRSPTGNCGPPGRTCQQEVRHGCPVPM